VQARGNHEARDRDIRKELPQLKLQHRRGFPGIFAPEGAWVLAFGHRMLLIPSLFLRYSNPSRGRSHTCPEAAAR
jgi:hypothetical protein